MSPVSPVLHTIETVIIWEHQKLATDYNPEQSHEPYPTKGRAELGIFGACS